MHRFYLLLFLLTSFFSGIAQPFYFHKQWDKRFGGKAEDGLVCLKQTIDRGYLLGGNSQSGISGDKTQACWGYVDYWVVKTDSLGGKQWDKRFGGGGADVLTALQQTLDGGYMLAGISNSAINGDKTEARRGGNDFWIIKIDAIGNKQWDKVFGGTLDDNLYAMLQTKDRGYLLGGLSNSPISGDKTQDNWDLDNSTDDFWVIKIDSLGNKQWDKRFGGTTEDGISALEETDDGGYILGGYSASDSSGDKTQGNWGWGDYWIVKIDSTGNKEWDKRYGGTSDDQFGNMIVKNTTGGYTLGGSSYSDANGDKTQNNKGLSGEDFWIVNIDSVGDKICDRDFGGTDNEILPSIVQTNDSGLLICGISQSTDMGGDKSENNLGGYQAWLVKTDIDGNKQWDKTIFTTGSGFNSFAIQTKDGCYAVARTQEGGIGGYKTEANWDTTNFTADYWIIKFCMDTIRSTGVDDRPQTTVEYKCRFGLILLLQIYLSL